MTIYSSKIFKAMFFLIVICRGVGASDLNGYASKNEVMINAPIPKGIVGCSGTSGANPNAGDEYVIRDSTGWAEINNHKYNKVFVCPNDYRSVGAITVNKGGYGKTRRKWIALWYSNINSNGHPARKEKGTLDNIVPILAKNQAIVSSIKIENAPWLVIDRLTVAPNGTAGIRFGKGEDDSHDVVINRILLEGDNIGPRNRTNYGIRIQNADRTTIQNSVIRNCAIRVNSDSYGIWIWGGENDVHIVNNEIYNCGQAYQHGNQPVSGEGLVVENNDLYVTPALYMDCGKANGIQKGQTFSDVQSSNGACMCAESILNHKNGSTNALNPAKVMHNRIWGAREQGYAWNEERPSGTSPRVTRECGGSGQYPGILASVLDYAQNIIFEYNVLFDAEIGFKASHGPKDGKNELYRNMSFRNNLIFDIKDYGGDQPSAAISWYQGSRFRYNYNTIANADQWLFGDRDFELACNLIVNGGREDSNKKFLKVSNNVYVDTKYNLGELYRKSFSISEAKLTNYRFYRKLITSPEIVEVNNVIPAQDSPFVGYCSRYVELPGYGID